MTHRTSRVSALVFLTCVILGCDEETTVVLDSTNEPPLIVTQFEVPTGPLVDVWWGPSIWVLAGDPDGLDDISAVFLDVETIRIHSLMLRPATDAGGCITLEYNPGEVVDASTIPLPAEVAGPSRVRMAAEQGGIYGGVAYSVPALDEVMTGVFARRFGCVVGSSSYLGVFVLQPPYATTATEVFLTRIDVEYIGVTVTVFDATGQSAVATFPDLRIAFSAIEEKTTPP